MYSSRRMVAYNVFSEPVVLLLIADEPQATFKVTASISIEPPMLKATLSPPEVL